MDWGHDKEYTSVFLPEGVHHNEGKPVILSRNGYVPGFGNRVTRAGMISFAIIAVDGELTL